MTLSGIGYDVHRLVEGRALILGGVEIPYTHGLDGHSDADVLAHAIADAVLGAIGERDIGFHFPNTDQSIRCISTWISGFSELNRRIMRSIVPPSGPVKPFQNVSGSAKALLEPYGTSST